MIWSPHSYNPETNSLGNWVMTLEECDEALDKRRVEGGDLNPQIINEKQEEFIKSLQCLKCDY